MKNKTFVFVSVLLISEIVSGGTYSGGTGEPGDPYRIATAEDMQAIGANPGDWDKHFVLVNDINLAGIVFNMIGKQSDKFRGTFDGSNLTISNLSINTPGIKFMGLFGFVGSSAEIRNLRLENASIQSSGGCSSTGALVGYNVGTILNCHVTGNVEADISAGGLVGYNNAGLISGCDANVTVTCDGYTGGLLGYNNSGTVINSYATGDIRGGGSIGGLTGRNYYGRISYCYASGSVTQNCPFGCFYAGGLAGRNYYGAIERCYATGNVTGSTVVGALVGKNYHSTISDCRASGTVTGHGWLGGLAGVNQQGSTISNCFATGNVVGDEVIGVLVGLNTGESAIVNCYATGNAEGDESIGALVGESGSTTTILNSYAAGGASGNANVGGLVGNGSAGESLYIGCFWNSSVNPLLSGVGNIDPDPPGVSSRSTVELQIKETFTSEGWDFVGESENGTNDLWRLCIDGICFPKLYFEFVTGDFICPDGVDFIDYSLLANHWQNTNCTDSNDCSRTDLDFSGAVDWKDLNIFCDHWLEGDKRLTVRWKVLTRSADEDPT